MSFRALGLDTNVLRAVDAAGYTGTYTDPDGGDPLILAGHDVIGSRRRDGEDGGVCVADFGEVGGADRRGAEAGDPGVGGGADAGVGGADRGECAGVRAVYVGADGRRCTGAWGTSADPGVAVRGGHRGGDAGAVAGFDGAEERGFSGIQFLVLDEADRSGTWDFCRTFGGS